MYRIKRNAHLWFARHVELEIAHKKGMIDLGIELKPSTLDDEVVLYIDDKYKFTRSKSPVFDLKLSEYTKFKK